MGATGAIGAAGAIGAPAAVHRSHPLHLSHPLHRHRDVFGLRRPAQRDRIGRIVHVDFFRRAQRLEQRNLNRSRNRSAPIAALADAERSRSSAAEEARSSPFPAFRFSRRRPRAHRPVGGGSGRVGGIGPISLCFGVSVSRTVVFAPCSISPPQGRHPPSRQPPPPASPRQALVSCSASHASASVAPARTLLFALCSLLFLRLRRLFDVDRRHERAVFQEVGRRGQRSRVRIHLDLAQIGGAGAVGVDAWEL